MEPAASSFRIGSRTSNAERKVRNAIVMIRTVLPFSMALALLAQVCLPLPVRAATPVALELVLAVDASSSVDDEEYALQVAGYVRAFQDPEIIAAIKALRPSSIAVTYVEWSDRWQQVQSVDWVRVHDAPSAEAFAAAIAAQANMLKGTGTALGTAISFSTELFTGNGFSGVRRVIDVSADDRYNSGSHPTLARDRAVAQNITVNALAVDDTGVLSEYFRKNVIGGPEAFVITANSFGDFAAAIKAKLLRELSFTQPVSGLDQRLGINNIR